jgi:hypothetical protein
VAYFIVRLRIFGSGGQSGEGGGGGAWVAKDIHEALDMADVLLLRLCLYFV